MLLEVKTVLFLHGLAALCGGGHAHQGGGGGSTAGQKGKGFRKEWL
jgi:hypothetical protein